MRAAAAAGERVDLLRAPLLGRFLRWRHARLALQLPMLAVGLAMVVHGFTGPHLAPKNLATVLTWVHYRGALILALLVLGNVFCLACPFLIPREIARRFFKPLFRWPRALRGKWLALGLLVGVLFAYELFDLWGSPWMTASLIVGYFAVAFVTDVTFERAPFCKFLCPIGQFNFIASTVSPFEVAVRDPAGCDSCATKDCIRGRRDDSGRVLQRGCELDLYLPRKVGNLDCTLCLDCVLACPHDNVALRARLPGAELADDSPRSGIGRLAKRPDLAALSVVFVFGALLNAFGMVSPVYAVEQWLARTLDLQAEWPVLGLLFFAGLVVEPVALVGLATAATRPALGAREPLLRVATRWVHTLVPLGFGIWVAHYLFHFLTGLLTFVPVVQRALKELGIGLLGEPNWRLGGIDEAWVRPIELCFLFLGLCGSLAVTWRRAEQEAPTRTRRAFAPWAVLQVALALAALWLLEQPMEMRATFLG